MNIRENVKAVLLQRGMTQVDLANRLGVSKQAIQAYLRGNVSIATLKKMADAMHTTVEIIVADVPPDYDKIRDSDEFRKTAAKLTCPHCGQEILLTAK